MLTYNRFFVQLFIDFIEINLSLCFFLSYKVKQEDIGRGLDVQILHHDVGLVRTKEEIKLPALKLGFSAWLRNNALDLYNKDIKVHKIKTRAQNY